MRASRRRSHHSSVASPCCTASGALASSRESARAARSLRSRARRARRLDRRRREPQRRGQIARRHRPQALQPAAHQLGDGLLRAVQVARPRCSAGALDRAARAEPSRIDGQHHGQASRRTPRTSRRRRSSRVARRAAISCLEVASSSRTLAPSSPVTTAQRHQRIVQLVGVARPPARPPRARRRSPRDRACPCRPRFPDRASGAAPPPCVRRSSSGASSRKAYGRAREDLRGERRRRRADPWRRPRSSPALEAAQQRHAARRCPWPRAGSRPASA